MDKAVQTRLNPVVLMSSDDWSETQKTSKYHLAIRLARGAPVLYVNSIGLRSVRATRNDVNRMWSKLQQWLRGPRRVRDNLHVFTPIVIPFRQLPGVEYFNRFLLRINLRWAGRGYGGRGKLVKKGRLLRLVDPCGCPGRGTLTVFGLAAGGQGQPKSP